MKIPFVGAAGRAVGRAMEHPMVATTFFAWSGTSALKGLANGGMDLTADAAALDPNTFERAGGAAGGVIGDTVMAGFDAAYMAHGFRSHYGVQHKNAFQEGGNLFAKTDNGLFATGPGGKIQGTRLPSEAADRIMAGGKSGVIKNSGKFLRGTGWKMMSGMILAPMAAHMLLAPAMGFAGKVIDEMYNQSRNARRIKYDERYIVNQQQDMTTNQQVGAAMDSYQNKMMSVSRIYHSR